MPDALLQIRGQDLGGMDERWSPSPTRTRVLQDMDWDGRGGWRTCAGYRCILDDVDDKQGGFVSPFEGDGPVHSIHWWSQFSGGIQWLMWEMGEESASLVYFDGSNRTWVTLATGRYVPSGPSPGTQYVSVGNNTWIVNGVDAPLRFDGRTLHRAGFDAPVATPSAYGPQEGFQKSTTYLNLGLGTSWTEDGATGTGEYSWRHTEINEFGTESPPSAPSPTVQWTHVMESGATDPWGPKWFVRVEIPPASNPSTVAHRMYRCRNAYDATLQRESNHYWEVDIPAGVSHVYVSIRPDSYLGELLVPGDLGPWPRGAKYIEHWQGTMWLAGMPEYPDRLVYSSPLGLENFPLNNYFPVGSSDSGEIIALKATRTALVVFKRRGIYIVTGNARDGFSIAEVSTQRGCSSTMSVQEVPGVGLVFANESGVYALTNLGGDQYALTQIPNLADVLPETWERVTVGALQAARSVVNHATKQYMLAVPVDGAMRPSIVLVYHYERRAWSVMPRMPVSCFTESGDHRGYVFFGSHDDTNHPGVHVISRGSNTKDGDAIESIYETVPLDFQGRYESFGVKTLQVFAVAYGNNDLILDYYADRKRTTVNTSEKRRDQNAITRLPVWDEAAWSASAMWERHRPVPLRVDPDVTCREFAFRVTCQDRMQIVDWELGLRGTQRDLRNPNLAVVTGDPGNR